VKYWIGNEQKFTTFCDTVQHHFNETCPIDYAPRFGRFLETKWGVIEQDVTKFKGNYPIVFFLCESKTWTKDAFQKLKPKHPKCSAFTFINVVTPLWGKCEVATHTPENGTWEASRTPENLKRNCRGQKPRIEVFFIPLERSWSVDVWNDSHEPFEHLQHKLWPKEGPGVKLLV
jgi:hypothetical protein